MTEIAKGPAPGTGATLGYSNPASRVRHALDGVPEDELLTLTLNGREVQARKGETIMEVCHREDVYVPHYCWHPALSIAGNCRLCLVDVEKVPKPIIACQTHVTPGMVVRTDSEAAKDAQKWMMEFLLVNHPLDCPICDRGGECQLQRYSMEYGTGHTRMADKKRKFIKPQADPLIDIERNRCIMCTRCVRFCDEVGGEHVMGVFDRGEGNYIGTFGQGPVSNIFSGNVIDLCPVGCLTSKPFRFKARTWELTQTQTTCDLCSSGCKVTAWTRNGKLYRTTPPSRHRHDHFTINEDTEEFICNQGRFASDYGEHESRQDDSLTWRAGRLVPTPFAEAVEAAARELRAIAEKHGPASIAVLVSPRATLEEGYLARELAKTIMGTPSVDWRSSYSCTASANAVSQALAHADGDLEEVPDAILVTNGKLVWQSPVLAQRLQEFGRRHGKPIVMLGHLHDDYLASHAAAGLHNRPGDTAQILKLLGAAARDGADASEILRLTGATPEEVDKVLEIVKSAEKGLVVHGLEEMAGMDAPAEVPEAVNLVSALGEGWKYLPVVKDRNAVGLNALGVEPDEGGVAAPDLSAAIRDGRVKGLFVFGGDALSLLRSQRDVEPALRDLETLVLADHFKSEYLTNAHVFLSLATNLERDGIYADIEGNLALLQAAMEPAGDSRAGWELLSALGRALGDASFGAESAEAAWALTRRELAPNATVTMKELELEGSTNTTHNYRIKIDGGARNRGQEYNPGNYRKDGLHVRGHRAAERIDPVAPKARVTESDEGFVLTWGSHVSGRGYINDRASIAGILLPKPFAEIHPDDARKLGVKDDQFAVLTVRGTRAKVALRVTGGPARGCLYISGGTYGPFNAMLLDGPTRVELEPLEEFAPDQGEVLVADDGPQESH